MTSRIVVACLLTAGLIPCLLYSQPAIDIVGGTEFNFGDVTTAIPAQKLITFKNIGQDTLIIEDVVAVCGCTGTLLSSDHIAPRDSGILSVLFNPQTYSGHVEKTVNVRTNDPAHGEIILKFSVNVTKALEFDPDYVFVKTVVDSTTSSPITLSNVGPNKIKILSVKSTSNLVSVTLDEDEIAPGKDASIITTITPKTAGTVTGNIEFTTNHPLQPHFSVRYMAWVKNSSTPRSTNHN